MSSDQDSAFPGANDVRRALQDYVLSQADSRAQKAEERDDSRNDVSAEALRELADYIGRLPEGDGRLLALANLRDVLLPNSDVFMPGANAAEMISRYGFDRDRGEWSRERAGEFFDSLVEVCQQEANHARLESLQAAAMSEGASQAMGELDQAEEEAEDA